MTITTTETTAAPTAVVVETTRQQLRDMLTAHLLSVGTDELLPVLCKIRMTLSLGELKLLSTDRYRLTVSKLTTDAKDAAGIPQGFDVLLHRTDAQRILKALPSRASTALDKVYLTVSGTMLKVDMFDSGMTVVIDTDAEQFPKIEHIVKDETTAVERIGFNPKYLADFAKLPREKNTAAALSFHGNGKPAHSDWEHNGVNYRHVIMAMRLPD